jgi:hypothetical protein
MYIRLVLVGLGVFYLKGVGDTNSGHTRPKRACTCSGIGIASGKGLDSTYCSTVATVGSGWPGVQVPVLLEFLSQSERRDNEGLSQYR